jgi:hypothetical protein
MFQYLDCLAAAAPPPPCIDGVEYKLFTRGTDFDPNSISNNGYDAKSVLYVRI